VHGAVVFQLDPRLSRRVSRSSVSSASPSSIGSSRPSTWARNISCLAFW
jgi:hypothetical protein